MPWRNKCHAIIAQECLAAYRAVNILPNGRIRKRHVPYSTPALAEALVSALDKDDEHEAKRLFLLHDLGATSLI